MSWVPMFSSFVGFFFLVSVFLWWGFGFILFLLGVLLFVPKLLGEVFVMRYRRPFSFFMFVFSEALAFVSLFVSTLWFEDTLVDSISEWDGLPAAGCLLLMNSSLAVSVYHGRLTSSGFGWLYLLSAIILGAGFVYLQLWELWECCCDMTFCAYYSCSFGTVGLHFLHVVLGLFVLSYVFLYRSVLSFYYITLSMWYWHFVDYMWLMVYAVVYIL